MRTLIAASAAALLLAGCASGPNMADYVAAPDAQPFDVAASACKGQGSTTYDEAAKATYELCMNAKGWSRKR